MKKTVFLGLLICLFSSIVTAKPFENIYNTHPDFIDDDLHKILSGKKFEKNQDIIQEETTSLSLYEREELFRRYKLNTWDALEGNFQFIFPRLGNGSRIQGDTLGSTVLFTTGLIGWTAFGVGAIAAISPIFTLVPGLGLVYAYSGKMGDIAKGGLITMAVATGILMIDSIIALIRPITYTKRQNSFLQSALGLSDADKEVSCTPVLDPIDNRFGFIATIKLG